MKALLILLGDYSYTYYFSTANVKASGNGRF
jgi:hypothetical protein